MSKKLICRWESTCDDDCRRPYGNCPDNCQNYKPYVSIEDLEKENKQLKEELKMCQSVASEIVNKMKNCENCKYYYCSNDTKGKCSLRNPKENKCGFNICGMWELVK